MNFIAIIGIVQELKKLNDNVSEIKVKVEKPFYQDDEDWYEILTVLLNNETFEEQIKTITNGMIVGVKGRLSAISTGSKIVGERLQVF